MTFKEFRKEQRISDKMFEDMSEAEKGELFGEFQTKSIEDLEKKIAKLDQSSAIKAVEDALKEVKESKESVTTEQFEAVKSEIVTAMEQIKALKESGVSQSKSYGTIREALTAAFKEEKVANEIATILKNDGKQTTSLKVSVQKAVIDMGVGNTVGTGSYVATTNTGIISPIRKRIEKYLANVSVGSIGTQRAVWIEEYGEDGTPIFIAEGATKTNISVKYQEAEAKVKKIGVYGKVTTEMLSDLPQLISYIENNLVRRVTIKTEDQLLSGDGLGDNLKGLETYATAFSAGAMAAAVDDANEFDVLNAVALQVEIANGIANAVFVHPSTLALMKSVKSTTGEPLWKYYVDMNGELVVAGMKVITTTAVDAGDFMGGDLSVMNVLFHDSISATIGLDGNDFINNKKTILVEQSLVQFASVNDTPCLVKGTFAAAKADLETP